MSQLRSQRGSVLSAFLSDLGGERNNGIYTIGARLFTANKVQKLVNSSGILRVVVMEVEKVLHEFFVEDILDEDVGQVLDPVIEQCGNVHVVLPAEVFVALY